MKKTAFVCFGADNGEDALIYQELPRKSGGEEFFLFFDPGGSRNKSMFNELFRDAVSASRLCHPLHYFNMFITNTKRFFETVDAEEEPFTGSVLLIMIKRGKDVYLFHNRNTEIFPWDNKTGAASALSSHGWAWEVPLGEARDQVDLFRRSVEDLFVLQQLRIPEGNWTLLLSPSREFVERHFEHLRNSIFFPSFDVPAGKGIEVEADRSFPALHWNIEGESPQHAKARHYNLGGRKVSIPLAVGTVTALLAIFLVFGPLGDKDREQISGSPPALLSAADESDDPPPGPADDDEEEKLESIKGDIETGRSISLEEAWKETFTAPVTSSPTYCEETVFFGCRDGHIYAYEPEGRMKWKHDTKRGIGASPCCVSHRLIGANYAGDVFCLDARTGDRIWTTACGSEIRSSPRVRDGMVIVGTMDGRVEALDLGDGTRLWSQRIGEAVWASAHIGDDFIIASTTDGSVVKMNHDGRIVWRVKPGAGIHSTPLCIDAAGIVVFGAKDTYVYAYSISRGDLMWRYATGGKVDGTPAADDKAIYVGSEDGNLYALDMSGVFIWKCALGGAVLSRPLIIDETVYVTSYGSLIAAVEKEKGEIVRTYRTSSPVYSSPCHDGERIFFGSNGGVFYALRLYGSVS
jgi:outer membrane protein assembly factor BamB